jgi:Zn-dependent M32 family carboxypeptidase
VIAGNGSSHKRRLFIVEFSDHYSKHIVSGTEHPIEDEHGVLFDRFEWTSTDWNSFTAYMIGCLKFYLQYGLQPYDLINVSKNALIQSAGEDFAQWLEEKNFLIGPIYRTKELFEEFKNRYYGPEADYKQRTFTNHLNKWAGMKNWDMKVTTDPGTKASMFQFISK